jgi:hypothetical protein
MGTANLTNLTTLLGLPNPSSPVAASAAQDLPGLMFLSTGSVTNRAQIENITRSVFPFAVQPGFSIANFFDPTLPIGDGLTNPITVNNPLFQTSGLSIAFPGLTGFFPGAGGFAPGSFLPGGNPTLGLSQAALASNPFLAQSLGLPQQMAGLPMGMGQAQLGGFPQQAFGGFPQQQQFFPQQQQFFPQQQQFSAFPQQAFGGFPQQQQFFPQQAFGGFPQQQQFFPQQQFSAFPQQQQFGGVAGMGMPLGFGNMGVLGLAQIA